MFTRQFLLDLLERSVATFAQAFFAAVLLYGSFEVEFLKLAAVAGGLAVVKSLAATQFGASDSGSVLPADVDPPADENV